jgi:hypothetical protein
LFFDRGLGLLQELIAAIAAIDQGPRQFARLQSHVDVQVGNVVTEIVAGRGGGLGHGLCMQIHKESPKKK